MKTLGKIFSKTFELYLQFYTTCIDEKKGRSWERERNFEKEKDSHESVGLINERIDIFYGDKSIFVAIHCSQKLRLKFNEELSKVSTMRKPRK